MKINCTPPKPMRDVAELQVCIPDIKEAVNRMGNAWNMDQFVDAVNSVQFFLMTIQSRIVKMKGH
jgi:hypothetical protein